jgi:tetratricopeptide (TPR) repeat protein
VTTWAINRVGWAFGYYNYSNPYYSSTTVVDNSSYNYSQPLVVYADSSSSSGDAAVYDATTYTSASPPEDPPPAALSAFDEARQQFYAGDYTAALASTDAALKELPTDAVIHEFRALTLFAMGNYQESAATLYAVLSAGPGWDWTTMSGLYPDVATYEAQLRAAEEYRGLHADDPAILFVLAYHYTTAGHDDAALNQLQQLIKLTPNDPLAIQLLQGLDPDAEIPNPPQQVQPPKPAAAVEPSTLVGNWKATRDGGTFEMSLGDDELFSWKFTQGEQSAEVTGGWEIDQDGILKMQIDENDTMLAQIVPDGDKLDFYMLGDSQGKDPLKFSKQ